VSATCKAPFGFGPRGPIPADAGIGLRAPHHAEFLATRPAVSWVEVHSENFFAAGGTQPRVLERVRADYPLSLHGVGLALGSRDPLDQSHLAKLRELVRRYEPALVSEHLCWGAVRGRHLNDLLPLPYTEEALLLMIGRVERVQETLGRTILIENVSSYLEYTDSIIPEWEFLRAVAAASGCGILLDVNNVYVSAQNHRFDARCYVEAIPAELVGEIHLAGHSADAYDGYEILVDTHGAPVADAVWSLYEHALRRFGPVPTLIEWDTELPALDVLLAEARIAQRHLEQARALAA
jgi:uncharacterized protein (UPF0276 family)